jgi:predicted Zn finger-like uncharacterized protein
MPEFINCPQCERKLRVPDDLLGRSVKCPTCGTTFTAPATAAEAVAIPSAGPGEEAPPESYQVEDLRRTGPAHGHDDLAAEEYGEVPSGLRRRRRADLQPHRGTLILVLGILSIVVCGFLGPVAWIMGSHDLKEIRAGRMDPEGEGTTNGGRICGIIGTILMVISVCCGSASMLAWVFSLRVAAQQGF